MSILRNPLLSLVLLWCGHGVRSQDNQMYSYLQEHSTVLRNGDSEFDFIKLDTPIHFYSEKYDHIYINTNGILTFVTEFPEFPNQPFPLEYPSIAVFYSNVDTTAANESTLILFFKSQSPDNLSKASDLVRNSFSGSEDFTATILYVATWEKVGYFMKNNDKTNTFQVAIICNQDETYVQLIYPSNGLNWLKADVGELGIPDIRAQAGFMSEDGRYYTLKGSGTDNVRYLSTLSNVDIPGVWLFRVGSLSYEQNVGLPSIEDSEESEPSSCTDDYNSCDLNAVCIDKATGYCCKCNEGYYGNGNECIKSTVPIRVSGSISGSINGKRLDDNAKLQSYVAIADGRTYSAINPISEELGYQLEMALPLGGAIGWLFGKPFGKAKNGFEITGGILNHLSTLTFDDSGDMFVVNQTFEGLNHWDQLAVKIEVSGNLPSIPVGSKPQVADFMEEYRYIADTEIQSVGTRQIRVSDTQNIDYTLDQRITFKRCRLDNESSLESEDPVIQKVSKISLDYHPVEQAIRIGLLNRIGVDPESNQCTDGSANCGANTICVPRSDEYDCTCRDGFTLYSTDSLIDICVDIDECQGPNACGKHTFCRNEPGGYLCECIEGYYRIGTDCYKTDAPGQPEIVPEYHDPQPLPPLQLPSEERPEYPSSPEYPPRPEYPSQPEYSSSPEYPSPPERSEDEFTYPDLHESECHKCSRDAFCLDNKCICNDGFAGDGRECIPICGPGELWIHGKCLQSDLDEVEDENETMVNCTEEGECYCPSGYQYDEERSLCIRYSEIDQISCSQDFNCHANATCEWSEDIQQHRCICPRGYDGDGITCTKIEVSCTTKEDLCDIHATCLYSEAIGKSECRCDNGYEGDGLMCQLAPECSTDAQCSVHAYCDNGVCLCLQGFERDISDFCVPAGSCGGTYCADNALCKMEPIQKVAYCDCMEGFVGDGVKSCKSLPPLCNVRNTCGLHATCAPSKEAHKCICDPGYYGDGYLCVEERNCRNTPSLCDRNGACTTTSVGLQCVCKPGYLGNGTYCKEISQHESGFLLISQGVVILRIPFDGKFGKPISVAQMAIGLDKDCAEGRIYWGDISAKKIMSSKYDGTDVKDFVTEDILSPEGIAIDWMSRRLYWTDSTKDTIEVVSLDNPKQRAVLINKYLVNPRGIAVDPHKSKIYWSDWNRDAPKIEMAELDGTGREILLSKPDVILPNSLVVLRSTGDLCFADAGTHQIGCLDTYTKSVRIIAANLSYPFGLTSTDQYFYWTDWNTKQIESVDIYGTRKPGMRTPVFGSHKMYGMVAITDDCPVNYSPCLVDNGGCPEDRICLINQRAPSGKSCKCSTNSQSCLNDVNNYDLY